MATVEVRVCDVDPRTGESVRQWGIERDGELIHVDLCDEHSEPLRDILLAAGRSARKHTPKKRAGRRRSNTGPRAVEEDVATPEELALLSR